MSLQMLRLSVITSVAVLCAHANTVPVSTQLSAERTRVPLGAEINLTCDVAGFPKPVVRWTKNGVVIASRERITFTDARLTVILANSNDTGMYGCHATNGYNWDYSTIDISVEAPPAYIPLKCEDNPYFATCPVIVKARFCYHKYYSKFCCKSCVAAGQLDAARLAQVEGTR